MKKAITVLFSAGLLLTAAAAWASNECYTLSGADYFGGDMSLKLTLQTPSGGVDRVSGQGEDSRGAARMIIELIDRSLVGWHVFYNSFTKEQESILPIMFTLLSIRNRLLKEFPAAMEFKRAGFDVNEDINLS